MIYQIILLVHVMVAVFIVALVLVQQGKGATLGAAFGSGASQTIFGSRGSGSFLFKVTLGLATLFFMTSIGLNYLATQSYKQNNAFYLPNGQTTKIPHKSNPTQGAIDKTLPLLPNKIPERK